MNGSVLIEVHGRVLVVILNRPDARNALNSEVALGVLAAFERLDADSDLGAGVLAGAGSGFCSGMDLKAFARSGPNADVARLLRGAVTKPVVAAVEGFAVAGGLELALTADLIVAARGAKLGIPEVKVGLFAAGGGLLRLSRAMPQRLAVELALTGEVITAEQAHAWGLVNRVVDPGQALSAAVELAGTIAENAPLGVAASKQLIRAALEGSGDEFWDLQTSMFAEISRSDDAEEGPRSFAEKRPPVWSGR